ncbi:DsbA family oxidoreductase [Aliifodinibius sp. S!AR15-10]|uniref:DsbA family oxidoreductase n=1 Tax=Aliifodinibius sp. S!AR15-10 TaxID=2950437 RepID=UPI00285747A9|nr:DsbA family oxidoreductase [Aliifodinibius sp. S!AR15-10]MDR8390041.1 DsbA family oxidoreductase [Aliifodinibius sp. S!AR15-10]
MKIEIWSDLVCPFCYIGKRKFEHALEQFEHSDGIEIQWRSYELQPGLQTDGSKSQYEHLADRKGWTLDYSKQVHDQLTETAKGAGLNYNFDKAIPANTFNAHRLSHLAEKHVLQDEMEERLFRAHFTDGKDINDDETLVELGVEVDLPEEEIRDMLQSDLYADEVKDDIRKAHEVGVQGVPFFVFHEKYSISGAQPSDLFLATLQKAYKEFKDENTPEVITDADGASCSIANTF